MQMISVNRSFRSSALLLAGLLTLLLDGLVARAQAIPGNASDAMQEESAGTVTETRTVYGRPVADVVQSAAAAPSESAATAASSPAGAPDARSPHSREAEKQYLKGAKALDQQDVEGAVRYFARSVELDPHNQRYVLASEIARQHLVTLLVEQAEKSRAAGHADVERTKLTEAYTLDHSNSIVAQHLKELAGEAIDALDDPQGEPVSVAAPIELQIRPIRQSFHVKAGAPALLRQVVEAYGLTAVIDESVVPQVRRLDAEDVDYPHAAQMVELVTGTFMVPLDPGRVLIAADTKLNRDKYERLAEETIYLPGLNPTDVIDVGNIARNIFDAPYATVLQQRGYMTLRAPPARMRALNTVLSELMEGQSQIELQIRAFEVSTMRTRNIGIQLPQQTTFFNVDSEVNQLISQNQSLVNQIVSSGLANAGDILKIAAILIASGQVSNSILSQPFVLFGGGLTETGIVPGKAAANLALNASDVRNLDDLSQHVLNDQPATFRTGVRYPIITSTVTSTSGTIPGINTAGLSSTLASLGINASSLGNLTQSTLPQIQYEDLGLTLKATPRVQLDKEVTLKYELEIEALGGMSLDNIPVLDERQLSGVITVKDGSTAMLVSNLNRQEARAVSGLPGLSELPGFGSATKRSTEYDVSRLVITVTTHVIRLSHGNAVGQMIILPLHQ
ncbi:MAG TPA: hypothetical protein VGD59_08870 [Acidisarcina sp.]